MSDPAYAYQYTAQDMLGQNPPTAGGNYVAPDMPDEAMGTVPPAPQLPPSQGASSAYDVWHGPFAVGGMSGQQIPQGGGPSPVVYGDRMYTPQYTPLSRVAFAPIDWNHRTWQNVVHPQPPTADATPRPDWNPFATLRNWPMQAMAGLKTTIYGGPQKPNMTGSPSRV